MSEIELENKTADDQAEFERQWKAWTEKAYVPIAMDHLKMICQVWYGRGELQGVKWARKMNENLFRLAKQ